MSPLNSLHQQLATTKLVKNIVDDPGRCAVQTETLGMHDLRTDVTLRSLDVTQPVNV